MAIPIMVRSLTLPTLDAAPAERERARGLQVAEDITELLRAPLGSIDARARSLENNSPLFRDSGAGGQSGLFSEMSTRIKVTTLPFSPQCDDDFDLLCECGHSYDDHTWSETQEGSDCEYSTCQCRYFRLKHAGP